MSETYEIQIQKDTNDDLFFELPPALLNKLGWKPGDDLKWDETDDGLRCRKINYATIELEFDDEELFKYMQFAHEKNLSFNQLVEEAVQTIVNDERS